MEGLSRAPQAQGKAELAELTEPREVRGEGRGVEREVSERRERICPRCGQPYSYIDSYRRGSQVYYAAVHLEKSEEGGRARKRKCYLGPKVYKCGKYGAKLLHLAGLADLTSPTGPVEGVDGVGGVGGGLGFEQLLDQELLDRVKLGPSKLVGVIEELSKRLLKELDSGAGEVEVGEAGKELAERLRSCYQLLLKAYGRIATKLYEKRFSRVASK
jgi:hypothetical protein